MRKKILVLLLSVIMLASFAAFVACGSEEHEVWHKLPTYTSATHSGQGGGSATPTHKHNYTAKVVEAPTCQKAGKERYTCTCGDWYEKAITPIAHEYEFSQFIWAENDGEYTATAEYACKYCKTAKQNFNATVNKTVTVRPTCETGGEMLYVASYNGEVDSKTVALDALGHDYAFAGYDWEKVETGYSVREMKVCKNDAEHVIYGEATVLTGEITLAAGCETTGLRVYDAGEGFIKTEVIPAKGHDYEAHVHAPTCAAKGYTEYICKNCTASYIDAESYTEKTAHSWNTADEKKICEEGRTCTVCTEHENARGHNYEKTASTVADCTHAATETYTCSHCGDSYTDTIGSALGHTEGEEVLVRVEETCEYIHGYKCTVCEETIVEGRPHEFFHKYTAKVTKEATCKDKGVKTYTCSECAASYTEDIAADTVNGHDWDEGVKVGNVTTYTCKTCAETKKVVDASAATTTDVTKEDLAAAGEVQLKEAAIALDQDTLDELGSNDVTLTADAFSKDDAEVSAAVEKLDDDIKAQIGDSKIYNFQMKQDGSTVSDFGGKVTVTIPYELGEGEDVDSIAIWYIDGEGKVTSIPASYSNGFVTFETDHFSYYTVTRLTPAQRCEVYGHNWSTKTVTGSCTTDGYTLKVCLRCGETVKENVVKATGHDYEAVETKATCTVNGKIVYSCKNCDHSYTETVKATGHEWEKAEEVAATCTAEGYTLYTCKNCDEERRIAAVELGHDYVATTVAPTCEDAGYTVHACSRCDESYTDAVTAPLGHNYVSGIVWSEGYATAKVEFVCLNDASHNFSIAATVTVTEVAPSVLDHGGKVFSAYAEYNGEVWTDSVQVINGVHEYGDVWEYDNETHYHACYCGDKKDITKHSGKLVSETPATCAVAGKKVYVCDVCGATYEVVVPATEAHDYKLVSETPATCVDEGKLVYACSVCGKSYETTVPATGKHTYVDGVCSVCGKEEPEEPDVPVHDGCAHENYTEVVIDMGELGLCDNQLSVYLCSDCGKYFMTDMNAFEYAVMGNEGCAFEMKDSTQGVAENGNMYYIATAVCKNCGAEAELYEELLSSDGCRNNVFAIATFKVDEEEVLSVECTVSYEYHGTHPATYELKEYGACGGTVYYNGCACGEYSDISWSDSDSCTIEWKEEERIIDGVTHYYRSGVCSVCGLEADFHAYYYNEGCASTSHEDGTITIGEFTIGYSKTNTYYNHKMEATVEMEGDEPVITVTCTKCGMEGHYDPREPHACNNYTVNSAYVLAPESETCEDGVYRISYCTTCGKVMAYDLTNEHAMVERGHELKEYGACGGYIYCVECELCGKVEHFDYSVPCNLDWSHEETEDGYVETGVCKDCGLTVSRYSVREIEGCLVTQRSGESLKIGDLEFVKEKRNVYYEHDFVASVQTLEDGTVVITSECAKCGVGDHTEFRPAEVIDEGIVVLNDHDGRFYYDYVFVPEESGYYTIESFNNNDTYVILYMIDDGILRECKRDDDSGNGGNFRLSYYLEQGATYVYRIRNYSEQTAGRILFKLTLGGGNVEHDHYNGTQSVYVLADGAESCEDGVYEIYICTTCGKPLDYNIGYDHVRTTVSYDLSKYEGSCGYGYVYVNKCLCGKEVSFHYDLGPHNTTYSYNNYVDDDGNWHNVEVRACKNCGLRISVDTSSFEDEENCAVVRKTQLTASIGAELIVNEVFTSEGEMHDYVATCVLDEGATSCEDGVTVTYTCSRCGKSYTEHYNDHCEFLKEKIDLAKLGSKCGGYASVYGCACGEYTNVNLDYALCEFDEEWTPFWIENENIVDGYDNVSGDYFDSYAYLRTCAVTHDATGENPCAFKIRYADYWVAAEDECVAYRYQLWQFGYDERTDTCKKELVFYTGETRSYHSHVKYTDLYGEDDEFKTEGSRYECLDCGAFRENLTVYKVILTEVEVGEGEYYPEDSSSVAPPYSTPDISIAPVSASDSGYQSASDSGYQSASHTGSYSGSYSTSDYYSYSGSALPVYSEETPYSAELPYNPPYSASYSYSGSYSGSYAHSAVPVYSEVPAYTSEPTYSAVPEPAYSAVPAPYGYGEVAPFMAAEGGKRTRIVRSYELYKLENTRYNPTGYERLRKNVTEYGYYTTQDGYRERYEARYYYQYVYESGYQYWEESIYERDDNVEVPSPFERGLRLLETRSNSDRGVYETNEYVYGYYKNYEYVISEYKLGDRNWERYEYEYDFSKGCLRTCYYTNSYGSENVNEESCHVGWYYRRVSEPTCTQDGLEVVYCPVCGQIENSHPIYPEGHRWVKFGDHYICSVCGLENLNGADGSVILEDLTEEEGDDYVIGYYNRDGVSFRYYVVLINKNASEEEDPEVFIDVEITEIESPRAFTASKAAISAAATEAGLEEGKYEVRFVLVPEGADGSFDYAITLTDADEGLLEDLSASAIAGLADGRITENIYNVGGSVYNILVDKNGWLWGSITVESLTGTVPAHIGADGSVIGEETVTTGLDFEDKTFTKRIRFSCGHSIGSDPANVIVFKAPANGYITVYANDYYENNECGSVALARYDENEAYYNVGEYIEKIYFNVRKGVNYYLVFYNANLYEIDFTKGEEAPVVTHTVVFKDHAGENVVGTVEVENGGYVTEFPAFAAPEGYRFIGWSDYGYSSYAYEIDKWQITYSRTFYVAMRQLYQADPDAYYIVASYNDWYIEGEALEYDEGNLGKYRRYFEKGVAFKIVKGNYDVWYQWNTSDALNNECVDFVEDGNGGYNGVIKNGGEYNVYLSEDGLIYIAPVEFVTVRFYIDGEEYDSERIEKGTNYDYWLPSPGKEGYFFDHWAYEDGSTFDRSAIIYEDLNLYAVFEKGVTVTYFVYDDQWNKLTRRIGAYAYIYTPGSEEGYVFSYWATEDGEAFDFTTALTEDITLYAVFERGIVVTYMNGEEVYRTNTYKSGAYASNLSFTNENGEIVYYWTTEDGQMFDFTTPLTEDIVLYPVFGEKRGMTVTYMVGEDVWRNYTVRPGRTAPDYTPEYIDGYEFIGWSLTGDSEDLYDFTTLVFEDFNLYAVYEEIVEKVWTVIGSMNGEEWALDHEMVEREDGTFISVEAFTFVMGDEFKVRADGAWDECYPEREGDDDNNWLIENDWEVGTFYVVFDPESKWIRLEAPVVKTYIVKYLDDGDQTVHFEEVAEGECATEYTPEAKEGFEFFGWKYLDGSKLFDFDAPIYADVTVRAAWKEVVPKYDVFFMDPEADYEIVHEETVLKGEKVAFFPYMKGERYVSDWRTDDHEIFDFDTPVTDHLYLCAIWSEFEQPVEPEYYLIGSMTEWQIDEAYRFSAPAEGDEGNTAVLYNVSLEAGALIKAIASSDLVIDDGDEWFVWDGGIYNSDVLEIVADEEGNLNGLILVSGNYNVYLNKYLYIASVETEPVEILHRIEGGYRLEAEEADVVGVPTPSWWSFVHGDQPFTPVAKDLPNASNNMSVDSLNSAGAEVIFSFDSETSYNALFRLYMASNAEQGCGDTVFSPSVFTVKVNGYELNFASQTVHGGTTYNDKFEVVVLGEALVLEGSNTIIVTVVDANNMGAIDCLDIVTEAGTEQPEPEQPEPENTTEYFLVIEAEGPFFAYAWKEGSDPVDENAAFPGVEMTYETRSGDTFIYSITVDTKYDMIIFSDRSGWQTDDLTIEPDKHFYYNGEWREKAIV